MSKKVEKVHKGRFQKKKLMEFFIKLAGWVLNAPVFHLKKTNMVLKHFILPVEHFKANLFFPIVTPPNPPHHSLVTKIQTFAHMKKDSKH